MNEDAGFYSFINIGDLSYKTLDNVSGWKFIWRRLNTKDNEKNDLCNFPERDNTVKELSYELLNFPYTCHGVDLRVVKSNYPLRNLSFLITSLRSVSSENFVFLTVPVFLISSFLPISLSQPSYGSIYNIPKFNP